MKILYLQGVSAFGGSTKSLLELYLQLKKYGIEGTVLGPPGKSKELLSNAGMRTQSVIGLPQFDNTRYGYYRGLRWLILIREFFFLFPAISALLRLKRSANKFDLIHANEITLLPIAVFAKKLFKCPLVIHVRSLQCGGTNNIRGKLLFKMLGKYADSVVAIDETVKSTIPNSVNVNVIHNGINLPSQVTQYNEKAYQEIPSVGIVGSLLRLKGIYELLEAARILLIDRRQKVKFIVVGENARNQNRMMSWLYQRLGFSHNVMADVEKYVNTHELNAFFDVKGFVKDVCSIYSEIDILCFPSYLNAAGRPVFEAAFFAVPSIVAVRDPKPDTIVHNVTGICIDNPDAFVLADAIDQLIKEPGQRIQLGLNARQLALQNFDIKKNANLMFKIYRGLIDKFNGELLAKKIR